MKILIVNDDGIDAPRLHLLTELAKPFGEITVLAPKTQCSAMSQHITVFGQMQVAKVPDFPVEGVKAYSLTGTPADCVKVGLTYLTDADAVFSGINIGINTGYDICYSGTVSAALEGAMHGLPSIAWSSEANDEFDTVRTYFPEIAAELLQSPLPRGQVWNVNFPGCLAKECRGITWNALPVQTPYYGDSYVRTDTPDGFTLDCVPELTETASEGTDLRCVFDRYISVGVHYNAVMAPVGSVYHA